MKQVSNKYNIYSLNRWFYEFPLISIETYFQQRNKSVTAVGMISHLLIITVYQVYDTAQVTN